jgi:hypothetical protein
MPKTIKIICDQCKRDITYTGNCEDYKLVLSNESIPHNPECSAVTCMASYPHIDHDVYFCNARCLKDWVINNIYKE